MLSPTLWKVLPMKVSSYLIISSLKTQKYPDSSQGRFLPSLTWPTEIKTYQVLGLTWAYFRVKYKSIIYLKIRSKVRGLGSISQAQCEPLPVYHQGFPDIHEINHSFLCDGCRKQISWIQDRKEWKSRAGRPLAVVWSLACGVIGSTSENMQIWQTTNFQKTPLQKS